jgi:hypothetical protein
MKVKCGKDTIEVCVEDLNMTIQELKNQLAEITEYTDIKLIHAGKVLKDDLATIGTIPGGLNAKLTMMGSTAAALESLKDSQSNVHNKRVIDDLTNDPKLHRSAEGKSKAKQHNPYKFEGIQTLPGLPDEAKARAILEELANDEGILAVMQKHKWSVGALCELYPEGYVGVSDVCVMGLNENHGQRILLRLRTDDMKGFRKILSIRKVLCHELAHNVHSEHDSNFYVLMRQVEREIVELDWKNGKARSLGGRGASETYVPTHGAAMSVSSSAPGEGRGGHVLGGSTDPLLQQFVPARYLAGTAALLRITAEEKELEDNCGSRLGVNTALIHKPEDPVDPTLVNAISQSKHSATPAAGHSGFEDISPINDTEQSEPMEVQSADETKKTSPITCMAPAATESPIVGSSDPATSTNKAQPSIPVVPFLEVQESILSNIDESLAFALSVESTAAPVEKLLALRDSVSLILTNINDVHETDATRIEALARCLHLLWKIVSNAKVYIYILFDI